MCCCAGDPEPCGYVSTCSTEYVLVHVHVHELGVLVHVVGVHMMFHMCSLQ